MAGPVKGDVVVVPFPFTDLSGAKRRPALVVAELDGGDAILCQITSQQVRDKLAIGLSRSDFRTGGLHSESNVRPNKLFTASRRLVLYSAGALRPEKMREVTAAIIGLLER